MGSLTYGSGGHSFPFDDRTLAHLQMVIVAKLRRDERFVLTWPLAADVGGGRSAVLLDPSIPLTFQFSRATSGAMNSRWLEYLMASANGVGGLHLGEEPTETVGGSR
ncbi:hypothetical protein ABIB15_002526 [Marisediminicola sp. UYEF4]|uniref:DUF7882 family protein n=1 Tax=Marisediminicola sp. UYEF4 TaxID=1756384 RepID=UPI00339A44DA